jgi:hypothetical protein
MYISPGGRITDAGIRMGIVAYAGCAAAGCTLSWVVDHTVSLRPFEHIAFLVLSGLLSMAVGWRLPFIGVAFLGSVVAGVLTGVVLVLCAMQGRFRFAGHFDLDEAAGVVLMGSFLAGFCTAIGGCIGCGTRTALSPVRFKPGLCESCGYPIGEARKCPECGENSES